MGQEPREQIDDRPPDEHAIDPERGPRIPGIDEEHARGGVADDRSPDDAHARSAYAEYGAEEIEPATRGGDAPD